MIQTKIVKNRGGRPSREQAGQIEDKILDAAAALFFSEGYGAASIERIAQKAHISKRTFYARFADKPALFRAVVHRLIGRLRPAAQATEQLFTGGSVEEILRRIAPIILNASLSPEALSLQRVTLAEAKRFPELALILNQQGTRQEAITRIAKILQMKNAEKPLHVDPVFAAEQFLHLLLAAPQRRALGLGIPMTPQELTQWAENSIDLFLRGCF